MYEDNYKSTDRELVATYDYEDADGNLVWQKLRYEPKGFAVRQLTENGGWAYNLKSVSPMLYNLPQVVASSTIFIVEGEKDVEKLKELGLVATTAPFGAGKWHESFNPYFVNKDVYIIPDNDAVGREHAEKIAEQLMIDSPVVKILDLTTEYPQLPEKGDISDLIFAVGADEAKAILERIIERTKDYIFVRKPKSEWAEIKPFDAFDSPSFPMECLPNLLQSYVKTVSDNLATPIEMAALIALALVAVCLQGKIFIQAKTDYWESINLYILIIAEPGERKSPLLKLMARPLYEYEKRTNNERRQKIHEEEAAIKAKSKKISDLEDKGNFEKVALLKMEIDEMEDERTHFMRLTSGDFTIEALTTLMAENDGKMAVISSEGGMFNNVTGRYSPKGSFETLLKAYTGDTIRVDRKSREPELIEEAYLTILLMAQESVLTGIMENNSLRGQGFLGRFLYCKPDSPMGSRAYDTPPLDHDVMKCFEGLLFQLLDLDGNYTLTLSEEASAVSKDFFDWIEPRLVGELDAIRDWASKLHGTTIRIAGILHCIENNGVGDGVICKNIMENACVLAKYFIEHAKRAFSIMGTSQDVMKAKSVLDKLEKSGVQEMSRRDIYMLCRNRFFKKADDIVETLDLLEEHGYIKQTQTQDKKSAGRKASPIYKLNPAHFEQNVQNSTRAN